MILQIENSLNRASELTRDRLESVVNGARSSTESVASRMNSRKQSVHQLSMLSLKLTKVGHQTADKLLKQQARLVENQLDLIAGRLKAAAKARDLRDLITSQLPLLPEGGSRILSETRATVNVFVEAGSEVRGLLKETVAELKGKKPAKRASGKKTAARKATTKKAAAKKTPAKKAAAKKTSAKKAGAKAKPASKTTTKKSPVTKKKVAAKQSTATKATISA